MPEIDDLSILDTKPFSQIINILREKLDLNNRVFLLGAGCSSCAGLPMITQLTSEIFDSEELDGTSKVILDAIRDSFDGAPSVNIEYYLSELIDLLAIADRRNQCEANECSITLNGSCYTRDQLRDAVNQIKRGIATIIESEVDISTHRKFMRSIHRDIRDGRINNIVEYLVLNYDSILEDALALERIPFADGIDGGVTGWWNPQVFDREGLSARVLKLHGSINWCELEDDPLPRRISNNLQDISNKERRILIWPASTKYRETQIDPYAHLIARARSVLQARTNTQRVLVICGYNFGDNHINIEIDNALRESAGNLTIIAFTSTNEPEGQLQVWYNDESIRENILIFANRGFFHGDQVERSEVDLLWWKFENLTHLLGGE